MQNHIAGIVAFMILGFINQKGGVGKTTLSLNMADYLARGGGRVLLIDADRQRSSAKWAEKRGDDNPPAFTVVEMSRENMARDAIQMSVDYDHVVIDGPRDAEKISRAVIVASEMVIIPIEPSGFSTDAASETAAQVAECQVIKPALKCGFVVSRKIGNTVLGKDIRDIASEFEFPVLDADIENRVAFAEAATLGLTIFEYAPESKAASEIGTLAQEIERTHGSEELQDSSEAKNARA